MNEIIFDNIEHFQHLKEKLIKGTKDQVHIITDFDRTLTSNFIKGRKSPSIIAALRDGQYLSSDYSIRAKALFDYYQPIEADDSIGLNNKKDLMTEWYKKHFNLLIECGLSQEKMASAIDDHMPNLRPLVIDFLDLIKREQIPLFVFSASGLGISGLRYYFSKRGLLSDNISFLANDFIWGSDGEAIGVKEPIIHSFNKNESMLLALGLKDKIIDRPNILLLGDTLADADMAQGYPNQNILKIGFLNDRIRESLEAYNQAYDVLVLNDGDFSLPLTVLKEIINDKIDN